MLEQKIDKIISNRAFIGRILIWILISTTLIAISLFAGMLGYHYFENMPWIDAFLNSAMLLGGMGEVDVIKTDGGKIFAGIYAIYCGMLMLVCGGLLFVPVFHHILHHFHASIDD